MTDNAKAAETRRRTNTTKQQDVVNALWKFAADLQFRPNQGCVAKTASGDDIGTKVSLAHVDRALEAIMKTFGYTVVEEQ